MINKQVIKNNLELRLILFARSKYWEFIIYIIIIGLLLFYQLKLDHQVFLQNVEYFEESQKGPHPLLELDNVDRFFLNLENIYC